MNQAQIHDLGGDRADPGTKGFIFSPVLDQYVFYFQINTHSIFRPYLDRYAVIFRSCMRVYSIFSCCTYIVFLELVGIYPAIYQTPQKANPFYRSYRTALIRFPSYTESRFFSTSSPVIFRLNTWQTQFQTDIPLFLDQYAFYFQSNWLLFLDQPASYFQKRARKTALLDAYSSVCQLYSVNYFQI